LGGRTCGVPEKMWIAAVVVPLVLLAVPLGLAHLEDRVISGGRPAGTPDPALQAAPEPTEPDAATRELTPEPVRIGGASPSAGVGHHDHRAA
jgi:hypothetical protein